MSSVKPIIQHWSRLLLVVLLLPIIGSFVLQVWMPLHQWHMREELENQQLTTLVMPMQQVIWKKKGKEIEVDGRYFDVKSSILSGNTITFLGLWDDVEKQIHHHTSKWPSKASQWQQITLAFGVCGVPPLSVSQLAYPNLFDSPPTWAVFAPEFYSSISSICPTPPPDYC